MGRPWWQRAGRALVNPVAAVGDAIGGTAGKVISNVADPGRMIGGTAGNVVSGVTNPGGLLGDAAGSDFAKRQVDELLYRSTDPLGHLSGADQVDSALKDQMAFADKGIGQLGQSYGQAQGLLAPYQQGQAQNFQDFQGMVRGGAFSPQYQGYGGPMSGGNVNPQFQGTQGPMVGGDFNPQFQGYGGPMSVGNVNPSYQGYGGPMSSGQQAPQYQQYGGPSQYQAQARPERMAATAENVNMFMDPGYKFRLDQGLGAIQSSAAAKGLLGSSATLQGINDYAQNAASQEFGNAYGRFQNAQNNQQGDFESDRGFGQTNFGQNFQRAYGMNQDANSYGMNAANFNQNVFEGDRGFGYQASQAPNAFNQQNADRTFSGLVGDRAAGLQYAGMQNDFGQQNASRSLGAFQGDRAAGMQYAGMQNDFNQQNAGRTLASNQFDMNFGYGMNQDMNTWNANQAQNNYGMWNGMVGQGYNAANAGANLATGYGQNLADLYAGQGNAYAAAAIAKANARSGLVGQGAGLLGGLMGGG